MSGGSGAVDRYFNPESIEVDESFIDQPPNSFFDDEALDEYNRFNAPSEDSDGLYDDPTVFPQASTGENPWAAAEPVYGPGVTPGTPQAPVGGNWDPEGQYGSITRYSTDSARLILNGMTSAELEALQRQFVLAGYVDEEATYAGRATLLPTFTALVQTADYNRVTWQNQIEGDTNVKAIWDKEHPDEGGPKYGPFIAPHYLKPDYATLAQRAKQTTEYHLGRKPTSSEMGILTGFMGDADRKEWQQNVYAPALGNWEKGARAFETEEDQGSETYQGYDAEARFAEYFDDRYENELDHRDRVDQVAQNSPGLFASIDKISRSI